MKNFITILLFFLFISETTHACSCGDIPGFCENFQLRKDKSHTLVLRVVVLSNYYWGTVVKVLDNIHNNISRDTVVVWGDNGVLCRQSAGLPGDTTIIIAVPTDLSGNINSNNEKPEQIGDLMIAGCGNQVLNYQNGKAIGEFTTYNKRDTILFSEFREILYGCVPLRSYETDRNAGVTLSPNPSYGAVNIESTEKIAGISLYDISGRLIYTKNVNAYNFNASPDNSRLASGLYFISITLWDNSRIIKKVQFYTP